MAQQDLPPSGRSGQPSGRSGEPSGREPSARTEGRPARPTLDCRFLASAEQLAQCPVDDEAEVAFVGRSNAGKSSTLNRLAGRKGLARASKTPGRTQLVNLFEVAGGGRLVDLPGYGYAKAPRRRREAWGRAADEYLAGRANLVALVLVMDARRPLQASDKDMLAWCAGRGLPALALLNKADKLKRGAQAKALRAVAEQVPGLAQPVLFSATTGLGVDAVVAAVRRWLGQGGKDGAQPT